MVRCTNFEMHAAVPPSAAFREGNQPELPAESCSAHAVIFDRRSVFESQPNVRYPYLRVLIRNR